MTRAAAHAAADVGLGGRLGEREVVGAEARLAIRAEHLLAEVVQRALQVAERDALVDDQALDLRELRQMTGIGDVAAIHLARSDDVDGRLLLLHDVHLHAGGLRAQQHLGLAAHRGLLAGAVDHVEGILHAAAGMVGRGVERLEVIVVGFHLGTLGHGIAQAQEDLGDLIGDGVDEMARAHLLAAARQRDVDGRRVDGGLELLGGKRTLALLERRLHGAAHLVHRLAHGSALLLRHLAHAAQVTRQRAGLAQHRHAHLLERGSVRSLFDGGQRARAQRRQLVHDCHVSDPFHICRWPPDAANKKEPSSPMAWDDPAQGREKALAVPPWLTDAHLHEPPASFAPITEGTRHGLLKRPRLPRPAFSPDARKGIDALAARVLSADETRLCRPR